MPASRGVDRQHNEAGADPARLAEWAERNYAPLRARADRHKGADRRIPLDPLKALRRTGNKSTSPQDKPTKDMT